MNRMAGSSAASCIALMAVQMPVETRVSPSIMVLISVGTACSVRVIPDMSTVRIPSRGITGCVFPREAREPIIPNVMNIRMAPTIMQPRMAASVIFTKSFISSDCLSQATKIRKLAKIRIYIRNFLLLHL